MMFKQKLLISPAAAKIAILLLVLMFVSSCAGAGADTAVAADKHAPSCIQVNSSDNSNNTCSFPGATARKLRRGKRYLDFTKGARVSWRTTVKNNILKVNTLWGYGFGYRVNFPFPDKADRRRPFFKRDVLHALADVLDGHGFDGSACLLKSYCTAVLGSEPHIQGGMLFKLLKMIFSHGLDGEACILKAFCVAHVDVEQQHSRGMLWKLLQYVFTLDSQDKRHFPYLRTKNCQQILHSHCPLSFNNISPFTDDV